MIPAPTQKDPLIKLLHYTNGSIITNWKEWLKERNMVSWEYIRKASDVDGVGVRVDFLRKYSLRSKGFPGDLARQREELGGTSVYKVSIVRDSLAGSRNWEKTRMARGKGREGKGIRNWRKGIYCETEDKLHNTLSTLWIILIFDPRVLGCHQTVLNSGIMMASVLCFEKYVGLLLSGEWIRLKAERPVWRLSKPSRRPIPRVRLGQ